VLILPATVCQLKSCFRLSAIHTFAAPCSASKTGKEQPL
jgi:hypothetical protein